MRRLLFLLLVLFSRPVYAQMDWRPDYSGKWTYRYIHALPEPKVTAEERATVLKQLRALNEIVASLPFMQPPRGVEVRADERIDIGCGHEDRLCPFKPLPAWSENSVMGYFHYQGKTSFKDDEPPSFAIAVNDPFTALFAHEYQFEHLLDENGNEIFYGLAELASVNGATVFDNNVVVLTNGRPLTAPVTREQYLRALLKEQAKVPMVANLIQEELRALGPLERREQAYVGAAETISHMVAKDANGAQPLVTINRNYFNPALPRTAVQLIAVHFKYGNRYAEDKPVDGDWTLYGPDAFRVYQIRQNLDYSRMRALISK